jgi:hypothetical protein
LSFTLHRIVRWPLASVLALATAAQAQCQPPAATVLVERFMSADCEACWASGSAPAGEPFVLDWIVPSPRGDEAPLAAAAIVEATARAGALPPAASVQRREALPLQQGLRVSVEDGPAWNGYIALRLRVHVDGAAPDVGAAGFLAVVESVHAGEEGTPIERNLVRALAGPLPLDPTREGTEHLLALRVPVGAKAERLGAVGWVQAASGQVIALTGANPAHCAK